MGATAVVTAVIVGGVMSGDSAIADEKITVDQADVSVVDEQKDVKIEVTKTVTESITTDIETLQKEISQLESVRERISAQLSEIDGQITKRNELIAKIQAAINNTK